MSDEGEESDSGERGHLSESPSPPLSVCVPRESPSPVRPLDLFSSASPLLGDTDPPYLASPEILHVSPGNRTPVDSSLLTPPKFHLCTEDTGYPFRSRRNVRLDAVYDRYNDPFPMWRGRGAENADRFQHQGQGPPHASELPDNKNHSSVGHIDGEFNSESRQVIGLYLSTTFSFIPRNIIDQFGLCAYFETNF